MRDYEAEDVSRNVKIYVIVFTTLSALTILTVLLSFVDLPTHHAAGAVIVVASVKASLIAAFFIHLISERKVILFPLLLCSAFLVALMALPVLTQTGIGPLWPL
jgi:cytochrome c oxidase subunit 4